MIFLILLLVTSVNTNNNIITTHVDFIELNHLYNDDGKHLFDQIIFYERSHDYRRCDVIAWKLIEKDYLSLPKKNGMYTVTWFDTEHHVLRRVSSKVFNETWTKVDPERINKKLLEEKDRTPLFF